MHKKTINIRTEDFFAGSFAFMTEELLRTDTITTEADSRRNSSASLLSGRGILVVFSSDFIGHAFVVDKAVTVIGRSEKCDIVLQSSLISKEHCRITVDDNMKFHLEDLGSTNATFVNGKMVRKPVLLDYGDKIMIGQTVMRFFIEENTVRK